MESPEGNSPVKGLSTPGLMDALREAQKIEPELQARGLAFCRDVLSKVDGFPTAHLEKCTVRIVLDQGGALVVNVPTYHPFKDNESITDDHRRKLALKEALSSLPGVAGVEVDGTMNSGIMSLNVTLLSDQVPTQSLSQAVEEVRGNVGEDIQRI